MVCTIASRIGIVYAPRTYDGVHKYGLKEKHVVTVVAIAGVSQTPFRYIGGTGAAPWRIQPFFYRIPKDARVIEFQSLKQYSEIPGTYILFPIK